MGVRLRRLREDHGLTQEQVASRAGFTAKYLSECERGLRDLPLTTLRAIVEDGLGAPLGEALPNGRAPAERAAFPRAVLALCRDLSALPHADRRAVVAIARAATSLARRRGNG
jgi:transcriptional regulator with XRE-family HTH domain